MVQKSPTDHSLDSLIEQKLSNSVAIQNYVAKLGPLQKIMYCKAASRLEFPSDVKGFLTLNSAVICYGINTERQLTSYDTVSVTLHFRQCLENLCELNNGRLPEYSLFLVHVGNDKHIAVSINKASDVTPQIYCFCPIDEPVLSHVMQSIVLPLQELFKKKMDTIVTQVDLKEIPFTVGHLINIFIVFWSKNVLSNSLLSNFKEFVTRAYNWNKLHAEKGKEEKNLDSRPEKRPKTESSLVSHNIPVQTTDLSKINIKVTIAKNLSELYHLVDGTSLINASTFDHWKNEVNKNIGLILSGFRQVTDYYSGVIVKKEKALSIDKLPSFVDSLRIRIELFLKSENKINFFQESRAVQSRIGAIESLVGGLQFIYETINQMTIESLVKPQQTLLNIDSNVLGNDIDQKGEDIENIGFDPILDCNLMYQEHQFDLDCCFFTPTKNSDGGTVNFSLEDILTSLLGPSVDPLSIKESNSGLLSIPRGNNSPYTDTSIQTLLRLQLNQDRFHIAKTQLLFADRDDLSSQLEIIKEAVLNAAKRQLITLIPFNTKKQPKSKEEDVWAGVIIEKINTSNTIIIKFVDPMGPVEEKLDLDIGGSAQCYITSDKDYKVSDLFKSKYRSKRDLRLMENGIAFFNIVYSGLLPNLRQELFVELKYELTIAILGIKQIEKKEDINDTGPFVVMDLVEGALGKKLKKYPVEPLRRIYQKILQKHANDTKLESEEVLSFGSVN